MTSKEIDTCLPSDVLENVESKKKRPSNSATVAGTLAGKRKQMRCDTSPQDTLFDGIVCVLGDHAMGIETDGGKVKKSDDPGLTLQGIAARGAQMNLRCFSGTNMAKQISQILSSNKKIFVKHRNGMYSLGVLPGNPLMMEGNYMEIQQSDLRRQLKSVTRRIEYLNRQIGLKEKELEQLEEERRNLPEKTSAKHSLEHAVQIHTAALEKFVLAEEEKMYTGDEDDRKAMLEHRQTVQQRAKELEKAKEDFIREYQERIITERKAQLAQHRKVEKETFALQDALKNATEKRNVLVEEKESLSAKLNAFSNKKKKAMKKAAKEPQLYPIDDVQIDKPTRMIFTPEWFDSESASRHTKLLAICDNLLLLGSKTLGTRVPSSHALYAMLMADDVKSIQSLHTIYQCLMELLVMDENEKKESNCRTSWSNAISDGCWPEILRRFVLRKDSDDTAHVFEKPDSHAFLAASILASNAIETLTLDQHISLLHHLTDIELLNTTVFRDALQLREKQSNSLKRDIKELAKHGKKHEEKKNEVERKLLYNPTRRQPLGLDRASRRYWWGIGGTKDEILIEDPGSGRIAILSTERGVEDLISSLDTRGIREASLHAALMAIKDTIILNMRRAHSAIHREEYEESKPRKKREPVRQSSRQTRQVEFFDPSKPDDEAVERKEPATRKQASSIQYFDEISILDLPYSVKTAYADAMANLVDIKRDAIQARISGPPGDDSWEVWTKLVTHFGHEYGSKAYKQLTSDDILDVLKQQACIMEKVLNAKSKFLQKGMPKQHHSSSNEDEQEDSAQEDSDQEDEHIIDLSTLYCDGLYDYNPTGAKRNPKQSIFLWQTLRERTMWVSDITSSHSPARLDYCIRILRLQSQPLIRKLITTE